MAEGTLGIILPSYDCVHMSHGAVDFDVSCPGKGSCGKAQTYILGCAAVYQPPALSILKNQHFFTPALSFEFTLMVSPACILNHRVNNTVVGLIDVRN